MDSISISDIILLMNKCLYCGRPARKKFCSRKCFDDSRRKSKIVIESICEKCGNVFKQIVIKDSIANYKRRFCSRACANSKQIKNEKNKKKIKFCIDCGDKFSTGKRSSKKRCLKCSKIHERKLKYCYNCLKCSKPIKKTTTGHCNNCYRDTKLFRDNLRLGLSKRKRILAKRSKNEIDFANLCLEKFESVKCNEPMFNGWDADVILIDFKLAILWNGAWHYRQCSKKHSVKQVQNRDKLKINEIRKMEYLEYVIKDPSQANLEFVKEQFFKLCEFLKSNFSKYETFLKT